MNTFKMLSILRNPYGFSEEEKRDARLMAANTIDFCQRELACLIPNPKAPNEEEWPCENPADQAILQQVYEWLTDGAEDE